jgi:hypothetical protein
MQHHLASLFEDVAFAHSSRLSEPRKASDYTQISRIYIICIYIYIYISIHDTDTHVCIYSKVRHVFSVVCICMHICIYMYIYTHTNIYEDRTRPSMVNMVPKTYAG